MDLWARQHLGQPFDEGGHWAASAAPDPALLGRLSDDPYFRHPPPKSTGTQHFSRQWLQQRLGEFGSPKPEVIQATLLALTVGTVVDAIELFANDCRRVLVCGGGANNVALMTRLEDRLERPVESTADFGIDPQWMEPMAFAWMAEEALQGRVGNLYTVTGASGPRILGTAHPA
jgi:anhydro-N-acetylmuramic acid kinase